jgi:predicted PurR-regulated permease PerM
MNELLGPLSIIVAIMVGIVAWGVMGVVLCAAVVEAVRAKSEDR